MSVAPAATAATAVRSGVFASDDADDTTVLKTSVGLLFDHVDADHYRGLVLEDVRIRPAGRERWNEQRAYFAFAGGDELAWKGHVGTDGETLLGAANLVRAGRVRQEYFVERDRLETPRGVADAGLFHIFLGAAYDIPFGEGEREQLTLLGGVQDFTGRNTRTHLRARYIAVLRPTHGLSLQLRARAFRNSAPFEYDYYSPDWFVEAMPTVQVRRFHRRWMFAGALGWGRQRDSEGDWTQARLLEMSVASPQVEGRGYLRANAAYSNTPVGSGGSYGYRQLSVEWVVPL